ncbi:MAG: integrase [Candidatus Scalindua rubra]|uniref:Integrase n=1 Tax=Candidatus Scalindua rubra TaxID=1872076 RepID=A0A1E3XDA6_9BACT|nr:MAG: integrase [Candidatus Scalindua rubra]
MSGLYRRGKMYWIDYRVNGRRYRESTGTTKRREAEYVHACRTKEANEGKTPEIKKIKKVVKLFELAKDYLKWTERQKVHRTKKVWVKQLIESFGNFDVKDLKPKIIEQWQCVRLRYNKPSTVNRLTGCLKHMVNKGVQWEMLPEEILRQVRKVKLLEENNKRLRFLTVEECQTLIDCCRDHLKPIVTVALHTGMRKGEVLGLMWEHIDLKHGFILLGITKNGERREIPINTTLEFLFKDLLEKAKSEYVFTDKNGKHYSSVKRSFNTACRKAGIINFRFHDLRHTFASHLVMAGIDLTSVKELLGHKSLTMTLRYAHLAPGHKRRAVNTLDVLLQDRQEVECDQTVSNTLQKNPKQLKTTLKIFK